jgi:predicted DCC family thiol-disulfide oxidoreductase YuxK
MSLRRDWNEFWFAPISSAPLGLFRLAFGSLIVAYVLLLFPDRDLWFSDRGVLTRAAADAYNRQVIPGPVLNLLHGVNDPGWLLLFFVLFLVSALCLALGLWTRLAAVIVFVALDALHTRNQLVNSGADGVMMVMSGYLVLAPAGAACSLDRLLRVLRGKEGREAPLILPWAQRLMQLQVAILYLITFLNKWSGDKWRDGTAAYWSLRIPDVARFPVPFMDARHLWLVNLATYGTLAVELALATLVWVPRLRLYVLAAGVLLHIGIEYGINIPLFSFLMIAAYLVFLREADLERFLAWVREALAVGRLRLVYDGQCDFCRSALLIVRFLDVFRLVSYLDFHDSAALESVPGVRADAAEPAMVAVDRKGRQFFGFYAFRALAWRLPAVWLLAPLLYLPGVPWVGRRAYRWIATHRSRLWVAPRYTKAAATGGAGTEGPGDPW